MGFFDFIPLFGGSKEKDTIDLIQEQVSLVYTSVEHTRDAIEALAGGNRELFEEKRDTVNKLEDQIDGITRKIEESLYSGAFLAVSRSRLLDFAEDVDDVVDAAKDVVNIVDVMAGMKLEEGFHKMLKRHMDATVECVGFLKKCVENINDSEKISEYIMKVRHEEHIVDTIAAELFHSIRGPNYDAKNFVLLSKMLEFMNSISDRSEDASDTLKLITLMHKP
jgi:predicted phosphate transport protein (TIGR00153 family)